MIEVDYAHAMLLYGCVLAQKPARVLELGIGTGLCTRLIVSALIHNHCGHLWAVDNWADWQGREPDWIDSVRLSVVDIVNDDEGSYVAACQANFFDLLVSDADHNTSHRWHAHYRRIVRSDGFIFLHDTNNREYPAIKNTLSRWMELPHFHFVKSSRDDEQCERGWLWVINRK